MKRNIVLALLTTTFLVLNMAPLARADGGCSLASLKLRKPKHRGARSALGTPGSLLFRTEVTPPSASCVIRLIRKSWERPLCGIDC